MSNRIRAASPAPRWPRRSHFGATAAVAQDTKIAFQLDWRFEGPAAMFLLPKAKGYFAAEKLDVTVDAGNGSGNAVNRVASGTYQMGFADLAALIEFVGNNPTAPNKPVAVMMVYDSTPGRGLLAEEVRDQGAGGPAGEEDGRAGVRRRPPRVPDLRQGEQARRRQDRLDRDGPAAARDDAGARRRRRHHRVLLHQPAQPQRPRHQGRGRRRDDVPEVRRQPLRQRDHRLRAVPEGEAGGGEGVPARVHQGHEGRAGRPGRLDPVREGARRAGRRGRWRSGG